jgi:arylsulfatase A-like enzyme/Flp pilus assembly protein TadD
VAPNVGRRLALTVAIVAAAGVVWLLWPNRAPSALPAPREVRAANLLVITIDTLRADAIGAYGSATARTPHIDALARDGVLFELAFATAPITLPSHASLLTGLYPPGHGARHNGIRTDRVGSTLAVAFKAAGGRTAAFVSAYPLDRSFGLAEGFDVYSDEMPRTTDGRLANERPGAATVDAATRWLTAANSGRFFAWVHLFEPHAPYGNPDDGRPPLQRYADEVTEADRQVGRLLDALGHRRENTVVVVAGDHGEAFGEHGEIAHSIFVYDTTLRVPLVIAAPGVVSRTETAPVSLADVAPTVAALTGLKSIDADGVDLRLAEGAPNTRAADRLLYAESFAPLVDFGWSSLRSLRSGRWKYIAAPRPELYDLDEDPREERNVIGQHTAVAADLASRVDRIAGPELQVAPADVDPDARRRLQALGYASGSRSGVAGKRRDPKDARALAAAIASMTSGELRGEELERTLHAVLSEDPNNPQANLRLGYLRLAAGDCKGAETLFARAIANGVAGADAHLGLATCQGRRGDVPRALASLDEARGREPQSAVVSANIGIALAALNQQERAIEALRAALARDPDLHEARFNLALAYARTGDRASAQREAQTLLARMPQGAPQRPEVERLARSLK